MYSSFTPFKKNIHDLKATDLKVLKNTPEGWYIEYKRELTDAKKIAKEISAFSNTYGGWLFYGIDEDKDRKAGNFLGLAERNIPTYLEKIQRAVTSNIAPPPHYEVQVIYGPNKTIGLKKGKGIIVIYVPSGHNAPYVHASGKIYRRVSDGSDPEAETDRHFLDLLWKRSKDKRDEFCEYIERPPALSEEQDDFACVTLHFLPDPWGEQGLRSNISFADFSKLMRDKSSESGGIPFDNIFSTNNGFICRQVINNRFNHPVFTWRFYNDFTSAVTLPLNILSFYDLADLDTRLYGYKYKDNFIQLCRDKGVEEGDLIDISVLYSVLYSIVKRKRKLLEEANLPWSVHVKGVVSGARKKIPFLDLSHIIDFYTEFGLPLIHDKTLYCPPGRDPDSCFLLERSKEDIEEATDHIDAYLLFFNIAKSMGFPYEALALREDGDQSSSLDEIFSMAERARKATLLRGKMS